MVTLVASERFPRRVGRTATGLAGALTLLAIAASPTMAATPKAEVFTLLQGDHSWTATGAFGDGGTWETYRREFGGLGSPVAFAGTLFVTLSGTQGTINLRLFVEFNQVQERDLCTVTGGTGAYARLAGQGTWTQVGAGPQAVLTCTANVNGP